MRRVGLEDRAGLLMLAALLFGGGPSWGHWTGLVLTLLALWLLGGCLAPQRHYPRRVLTIPAAIALLLALQLVPLPAGWLVIPGVPDARRTMLTLDAGRTLDAAASLLPAFALFWSLQGIAGRLPAKKFLLAGVAANIVLALLQFLQAGSTFTIGLPYAVAAGAFANSNHFAALLAASLPLIALAFLRRGHPGLAAGWAVAAIAGAAAAGSAMGVALTVLSAAASAALFVPMPRPLRLAGLALLALAALALVWPLAQLYLGATGLDRPLFARTTFEALLAYWPWGSGMGTFDIVYPQVEQVADIFEPYVNHAHNDFLELGLEGGEPGIVILVIYLGLVVAAAISGRRDKTRLAALLTIGGLLLHSAVDYPLRTAALQIVFAYANALLFLPSRQRDGEISA